MRIATKGSTTARRHSLSRKNLSMTCLGALSAASLGLVTSTSLSHAAELVLEEVVVSAQKREESLQDTPISLVAFGAGDLLAKGINNLQDLQTSVPNLQLAPFPTNAGTPRIFMRGIGNNSDAVTEDAKVAVYLNGVYLARSQGLAADVADIERIEVLRGPQGTLYGRNATGGAVNFIIEQPDLGALGFKQQVTVGNRDLLRLKTAINLPVSETFAARLSYLTVKKDGFVKNRGTGTDRFGNEDRQAYMLDFLWQPSDRWEFRYTYDRSDIKDSPAYIAVGTSGFDTGRRPSSGSPFVEDLQDLDVTTDGHALTATWQINDHLTLKSISAYRELEEDAPQDHMTGVFGPFPFLKTRFLTTQEQFSQEFQLLGDAFNRRLEYIAGLYYFEEEGEGFDTTLIPLASRREDRLVTFDNTAYAAFGQATWTPPVLEDRLHITLGARWSRDRRLATLNEWAGPLAGPVTANTDVGNGRNTFTNFSPSLVVAYDITEDVNLYAKVVEGYKTGGFNIRASSVQRFNAGFDEETLTSYEIGTKSQWWNNRLRTNLAVFQADYTDIQIQVASDATDPTLTDVLNAGKATINGAELDITALLSRGLTVDLRYGYLDPGYDKIVGADGANIADQFNFIHAPRHSYAVDINYELPRLPLGLLTAHINYTWQDEKHDSAVRPLGVDNYGLLNARLTLSEVSLPAGEIEVALWGRNLENKEYLLAHMNYGPIAGAYYGEPRTYGIDLIYHY